MQLLPQYEKAILPIGKLRDYALNPDHPEGKHKAKVFKAALGIERTHAEVFAQILEAGLIRAPAVRGIKNEHGQRWTTYHEIVGLTGRPTVVTVVWIYRPEEPAVPVLVSCYIEPGGPRKLEESKKRD